MFSAMCRRLLPLALAQVLSSPPLQHSAPWATPPNTRPPAICYHLPGRMTGTPAEMLSADYLRQQFAQMGYQSDVRSFTRYIYTDSNQRRTGTTPPAARLSPRTEGQSRQQIIIMAHLDTYAPQSDKDVENNLGGPDAAGDRR